MNLLKMTPRMIVRRGHYLYFAYYFLYGIISDFLLAGRLMNRTVFNDNEEAYPAQCLSYPYLQELSRTLVFDCEDVFVDVGCAWGRALGYLRRRNNIKKWIGVEYNPKIAEQAKHVFVSNTNVEILSGDIIDVFPDSGTVFYLFNPFGEETLDAFLNQIEEKAKKPIRLLYLYPTCRIQIDLRKKWRLIREVQLKPRHLAPITLCEYWYGAN